MYHKALALNIVAGSTEFMCYTAAQLQWCSWRCQQALRHTPAELSPQCAAVPLRSTNERQRHSIEVHKQRAVVFVELTNKRLVLHLYSVHSISSLLSKPIQTKHTLSAPNIEIPLAAHDERNNQGIA